jgi:hypothetical protein
MTTNQEFYVKKLANEEDKVTLYDSLSGDEFKIRPDMAQHYLNKIKKRTKFEDGSLQTYGDWIPVFVKTKEEIIGSPSSSVVERVAPSNQVKAGKRRRGRRGKKK